MRNGGALLPIAAPSMPCEANRPLASHLERNRNQTRGMAYPALRRQRVLLREQSAAWEDGYKFTYSFNVFPSETVM